jgi:hypothetical protein
MSDSLYRKVIKLAYDRPELRPHLLPILTAAETFSCPECDTKVLEQTGYCVKCKSKVKEAGFKTSSLNLVTEQNQLLSRFILAVGHKLASLKGPGWSFEADRNVPQGYLEGPDVSGAGKTVVHLEMGQELPWYILVSGPDIFRFRVDASDSDTAAMLIHKKL